MNQQNDLAGDSWLTWPERTTPTASRRNSSASQQSADSAKLQTQFAPTLLDDSGHYSSSSNTSDFGAGSEIEVPSSIARFQTVLREKDKALFLALQDVRKLSSELERLGKSEQWYKKELRSQKTTRLDTLERLYAQERNNMRENQRLQGECVRLYEKCGEMERKLEAERTQALRQLVSSESTPSKQPCASETRANGQNFEIEQQIALIDDQQQLIAILRKQKRSLLDDLRRFAEEKDEKVLQLQRTLAGMELENSRITMTCKQLLDERNRLEATLQKSESQLQSETAEKSKLQNLSADLRQQLDAHETLLAVKKNEISDMQRQFEVNLQRESNMDEVHRLSMVYHNEIGSKTAEIVSLKTALLTLREEIGSLADLQTRNEEQERLIEHLRFTLDARKFELEQLRQTNVAKAQQITELKISLEGCRAERGRTLEQLHAGDQTMKTVEQQLIALHERYASMCVLYEQTKFALDMREIELGKLRLQTDDDRTEIEQLRGKLRLYFHQTATLSQRIAEVEADRQQRIEEKTNLVSQLGALEANLQKATDRLSKSAEMIVTEQETKKGEEIKDQIDAPKFCRKSCACTIQAIETMKDYKDIENIEQWDPYSTEKCENQFCEYHFSSKKQQKLQSTLLITSRRELNSPRPVEISHVINEVSTKSSSLEVPPSELLDKNQTQSSLRAKHVESRQTVPDTNTFELMGRQMASKVIMYTQDVFTCTDPMQRKDVVEKLNGTCKFVIKKLTKSEFFARLLESMQSKGVSEEAAEALWTLLNLLNSQISRNLVRTGKQEQLRSKKSKRHSQFAKQNKRINRRTIQALIKENSTLRHKLAKSDLMLKAKIVRLEKSLKNAHKKKDKRKELKNAITEREELRALLNDSEARIRKSNLRLFEYDLKSKFNKENLCISSKTGSKKDLQPSDKRKEPQIEIADKDKYIAKLQEELQIHEAMFVFYNMNTFDRMNFLEEVHKCLASKVSMIHTILGEWQETAQHLSAARRNNEKFEIELQMLRAELERLNKDFDDENHVLQQLQNSDCWAAQFDSRLDDTKLFFDKQLTTITTQYQTKINQLMCENERIQAQLKSFQCGNGQAAVSTHGTPCEAEEDDYRDIKRDENIASTSGEGVLMNCENMHNTCEKHNATIQALEQYMQIGRTKSEALLLDKIDSLPENSVDEVGNLIDDFKNLLQLSATVTCRPKTSAILDLIERSNSCAPNLNKLDATVQELHYDIRRLIAGIKKTQIQTKSGANETAACAAPSLLEELRDATSAND